MPATDLGWVGVDRRSQPHQTREPPFVVLRDTARASRASKLEWQAVSPPRTSLALDVAPASYRGPMAEGLPSLDLVASRVEVQLDHQLRHFDGLDNKAGIVLGFAGFWSPSPTGSKR